MIWYVFYGGFNEKSLWSITQSTTKSVAEIWFPTAIGCHGTAHSGVALLAQPGEGGWRQWDLDGFRGLEMEKFAIFRR